MALDLTAGQLLTNFIFSLVATFSLCVFLVLTERFHIHLSADNILHQPQKIHSGNVSRIGGVAIFFVAVFFGVFSPAFAIDTLLLACSLPAVFAGFWEDFRKHFHPRWRLLAAFLSALLAVHFLNASIRYIDLPLVGKLYLSTISAFIFSAFVIAGFIHSINLIDGVNGLASGFCAIVFAALATVGYAVNDLLILTSAVILLGASLGFWLINFPFGKLFLGDGGAYFLGFTAAVLSVLLCMRNQHVSTWFAAVILIYPVFETLFTILRRKFYHKTTIGNPDRLHLHSLLFQYFSIKSHFLGHFMTSGLLLIFCALNSLLAVVFYKNTVILMFIFFSFCVMYSLIYIAMYRKLYRQETL